MLKKTIVKRHIRRNKGNSISLVKSHSRKLKPNVPVKTPSHPTKSHIVLAKEETKEKLIRFRQQGVEGSPRKEGESEQYRKRREAFKARHAKNIAKGKMSAAYWADKVKW